MDLTTSARVLTVIESGGEPMTSGLTSLVSQLISDYSAQFESYLNREVTTATYTEYFDVDRGQRVFSLKAYPVSTISSVHSDTTWTWTTGTVDSDERHTQEETGMLRLVHYDPSPGPGSLRVIYRGGMAPTAASFVASYPDIASAMDTQVAYHLGRRDNLGSTGIGAGGANVSWTGAINLLPSVRSTLNRYKRWQTA